MSTFSEAKPAAPGGTEPAPPSVGHFPRVNLFALSFFWFPINLFWTVMLTNFLPSRVEELVGTDHKGSYLTIITFAGGIATTVIQLIVGPISDASANKWGRRHPFIFWGTLVSAIFILLFGYVGNFWLLMVSFFGIQIFLNAANGAYQPLMPDNVPPSRHGIASAYMGVALLVGQLLGAVSLIFLRDRIGVFGILVIILALLLIGMAITVTLVPDRPARPADQMPWLASLVTLRDLGFRRYPDFYGLLYSRFFINMAYSTVVDFILFYLQDTIGPREDAHKNNGFVLLSATVAALVGTLVAGHFADRVPKKHIIFVSCAIIGVAALVFGFTSNMTTVLILAGVFGLGWGAFQAVDWALASNLLPQGGGTAKYMAVWHVCVTVPQLVVSWAGLYGDPINKQFGHGMGWRVVMLSTVVYIAIGTHLLRRVHERTTEELEAAATASGRASDTD